MNIDSFAPRFAFYCSAHLDLFEELAKLRAARRIFAKLMKDRYGAKDENSMKFKFGVHTAGCSLVPQQPENNIIRVAYEALTAVLAGVQSLHCCSYDEPIALPTEDSVRLAIRTQQILAYETGVAKVADPLGGSYYLESLTDQIEQEIYTIMRQIENEGGMRKAIESGWVDSQFDEVSLRYQREVETNERIVVGQNAFQRDESDSKYKAHKHPAAAGKKQTAAVKKFKKERNEKKVKEALLEIKVRAEVSEKENLIPVMIEASKKKATLGEMLGTLRVVMGETYEPFGILPHPFF
jgi:methylmalonyl-CoA mutase N-terminal domain/subunit